ncbi:hypothetical protein SUDANB146_03786 [Streptomyces sp. enrichment culture]
MQSHRETGLVRPPAHLTAFVIVVLKDLRRTADPAGPVADTDAAPASDRSREAVAVQTL